MQANENWQAEENKRTVINAIFHQETKKIGSFQRFGRSQARGLYNVRISIEFASSYSRSPEEVHKVGCTEIM